MRRGFRIWAFLLSLVLLRVPGVAAEEARNARVVENLFGADLLDDGTGWVVGAFGAIFKTTDGGLTWTSQKTPTVEYLFSVDFASKDQGVAVGKGGVILSTVDGGKTWVKRESPTDLNLFSVAHASPTHVWAVGDWGRVLESTDGGTTWLDRTLEHDVVLTSQSWADDQHGVIAGEFGTILVTADGGKTFEQRKTGTDKTMFGVAYPSKGNIWAVGIDGLILRSRDDGQTWEAQRGSLEMQSLETLGFMEAMRNPGLYDIGFAEEYGYVVGDIGMVLVSSDHGETWVERKLPHEMSLFWIRGVAAAGKDRALLVGANGLAAPLEKDRVKLANTKRSG